jgi:hypothetical protein
MKKLTQEELDMVLEAGQRVCLAYTDLSGLDFSYAYLEGAILKRANLKGANFENANLYEANLEGANLEGANLTEAEVSEANFRYANLRGVNLRNTSDNSITDAVLDGAVWDQDLSLCAPKSDWETMTFKHYGGFHFEPKRWKNVKNMRPKIREQRLKLYGGLWASPVGDGFLTWADYISQDWDWEDYQHKDSFIFSLAPQTKIIMVRTREEMDRLTEKYGRWESLDYKAILRDGYDAVYFEVSADREFHLHYDMVGLDVDSLVVLNPTIIVEK